MGGLPSLNRGADEFRIAVRIYYEDTDTGGVVYNANYLKYMERARSDWLRALGFSQVELASEMQVVFAVRSVKLNFIKPALLDDLLTVSATVMRRGPASLVFAQVVRRDATVLCTGEIKIACLDARAFAPVPIPASIASRIDVLQSQQGRT